MSRKGKDKVGSVEGGDYDKVRWDDKTTGVLVELCYELMKSINRVPGSRIPKIEWEDLIVKFNAKTKLCWPKHALKNRWDALRKDWTLWTKMMSKDTGIGWNPELGTVDATNEWWEERFKENKEYAKFRKHGFKFKQELEFCFAGTYATGAYRRAPSSRVVQTQNTSVRIENQNQEDSDGFQAWFDDEPYVPDPPLQDLNIDISPVRVVNEHHDEVYSTATSPLKVQSVTPTPSNGSFRKRSSQMSGSRIRKKQATNKDEHMVELVQAVQNVAGRLNSPSHGSSMGDIGVQSQYGRATAILKKMLHEQHLSTDLYLFAVDLLRDNMNSEFFIDCDDLLRLPFIERKFTQYQNGKNFAGL
ncbi:uncharacterized protein LOC119987305 isoform X2 [Tripterygium wilfordii]|nr:uncharacterized protein LOC119987305 isoform X2 [Tripterygium wilfordii]